MQHYNIDDFLLYFGQSYFLHPNTGEVVQALGRDRENPDLLLLSNKDRVKLNDLDWKHVTTPVLGYRNLFDGKALYYITRRAGRRTQKGVTPLAIVISIPPVVREIAEECGVGRDIENNGVLSDKLAKAIWNPEYTALDVAVEGLRTKRHALGYALSRDWAITLGLFKSEPFLLHFKNIRVAGSIDGLSWNFYNKDSEKLFQSYKETV